MAHIEIDTEVLNNSVNDLNSAANACSSCLDDFASCNGGGNSQLESQIQDVRNSLLSLNSNVRNIKSIIKEYVHNVEGIERGVSGEHGSIVNSNVSKIVSEASNTIINPPKVNGKNLLPTISTKSVDELLYSSNSGTLCYSDFVLNGSKDFVYIDSDDYSMFQSKLTQSGILGFGKLIEDGYNNGGLKGVFGNIKSQITGDNEIDTTNLYLYYKLVEAKLPEYGSIDEVIVIAMQLKEMDEKNGYLIARNYVALPTYEIKDGPLNIYLKNNYISEYNDKTTDNWDSLTLTEKIETNKKISNFHFLDCEGEYVEFYDTSGYFPDIRFVAPLYKISSNEDGGFTSIPLTEEEKTQYLEDVSKYFGLIGNNCYRFSDYYIQSINGVNTVILTWYDDDDNKKGAGYHKEFKNDEDNIIMLSYNYFHIGEASLNHNNDVGGFVHESGHAFAAQVKNEYGVDVDDTKEWNEIYNQLFNREAYTEEKFPLTDYSFTNEKELFAEATVMYWNQDGNANWGNRYNVNDLKEIDIVVDGETITLYDYMDSIYNKGVSN